jgi:hypothetical protein
MSDRRSPLSSRRRFSSVQRLGCKVELDLKNPPVGLALILTCKLGNGSNKKQGRFRVLNVCRRHLERRLHGEAGQIVRELPSRLGLSASRFVMPAGDEGREP